MLHEGRRRSARSVAVQVSRLRQHLREVATARPALCTLLAARTPLHDALGDRAALLVVRDVLIRVAIVVRVIVLAIGLLCGARIRDS